MILSLVLAASLSSQYLDEFFTLPAWHPTEVTSFNTPGSDPNEGGGWYVDTPYYTNEFVRVSDWIVESEEGKIECTPEYKNGQWVIESVSKWPDKAYDPQNEVWSYEYALYVYSINGETDRDAMEMNNIEVARGVYEETPSGWHATDKWYYPLCYRTNEYRRVLVHNFTPRAPRLTPEVQAGVLSTFAGYAERQYYALQGQSNIWDTATYGPRSQKHFWFDPLTNDCEFVYEPFSHTPSNRTVRTRRLVEYDNINGLAEYMMYTLSNLHGFYLYGCDRPGWLDAYLEGEDSTPRGWWGTTDTQIVNGRGIVPSLNWKANPTVGVDWNRYSWCFANLYTHEDAWPTDNWNGQYGYQHRAERPLVRMMEKLKFGNPYYGVIDTGITTNTMVDVIEAAYPHADGCAVTNATRRLVSDRLCCMNQVLGLMDRTFYEPEVIYPSVGTNTTYQNMVSFTGVGIMAPQSESSSEVTYLPVTIADGSIDWNSGVATNRTSSNSVPTDGASVHWRVSATSTGVEPNGREDGFGETEFDEERALAEIESHGLSGDFYAIAHHSSSMYLYNNEMFLEYYLDFAEKPPSTVSYSLTIHQSVGSISNAVFYLSYNRSYIYAYNYGYATLGPTQPGFQSGDRVASSRYGGILGAHWRADGISQTLADMAYSSQSSQTGYKSYEADYTTRRSLLEAEATIHQDAGNRFVALYGLQPTAWASIIPIDMADATRVRDSLKVREARLTPSNLGWWNYLEGTREADGPITVTARYAINQETGVRVEGFRPMSTVKLTCSYLYDQPDQEERDPLAMDAKLGIMTRTDWSWKTLKRGDD